MKWTRYCILFRHTAKVSSVMAKNQQGPWDVARQIAPFIILSYNSGKFNVTLWNEYFKRKILHANSIEELKEKTDKFLEHYPYKVNLTQISFQYKLGNREIWK